MHAAAGASDRGAAAAGAAAGQLARPAERAGGEGAWGAVEGPWLRCRRRPDGYLLSGRGEIVDHAPLGPVRCMK
jgi:hypothetical protein